MSPLALSTFQSLVRDSLELASLASSDLESTSSHQSDMASTRNPSFDEEDPLNDRNPARSGVHHRSYSGTSAFNFSSNLFPLSSTNDNSYVPIGAPLTSDGHTALGAGSLEKHKTLTYLNGLSLIIGIVVGSGIFSSPSQVNVNAGSPGASLIVWALAGILAWTGASSYAELGGAIPLNGGAQVYLAKIFGELFGFVYTWCAIIMLKPSSNAIVSIIMGEYLIRAVLGPGAENLNVWNSKSLALVGLYTVTLLNCLSTKLGTRIGDYLMFLKFIALTGVTIIGIVVAVTGLSYAGEANQDWKTKGWFEGTSTSASHWAVALYAGLWAFDGWDNTSYVVGEFRNPSRDLPRVIHTALPLIILSYISVNVAYFFVLPLKTLNSTNTVAVTFGSAVFGPIGSLVLALVISASCLGSLNATTFTSGRLVYAAGKESYVPAIFGEIGLRSTHISTDQERSWTSKILSRIIGDEYDGLLYTPIYAMLLNAMLTTFYVFIGEFSTLITFYGVAGYTFHFITLLGLIVLRVREPNLERPYKTWITTPIIFCCVCIFLISRAVFAQPLQTVIVMAFIATGVPVYYWRVKGRDRGAQR
ncbi:hypothetical protein K3495_g3996 [Podosphaera aphanis]|nr:hypothetical protein K3495_g3996 [Podosphaera aphanis]